MILSGKGADMNGRLLSAKHPGDTIVRSDVLDVLRCRDKERTCRELALICSAIEEDEEIMVRLGLEGVHIELHRLLMSKDEDVSEAAAQAIDACVRNCPYGVSFPMTAKRLDDSFADPFITIDLGTEAADVGNQSQAYQSPQYHQEDGRATGYQAVSQNLKQANPFLDHSSEAGQCSFSQAGARNEETESSRANPLHQPNSASLSCSTQSLSQEPQPLLQFRLRKVREHQDSHRKIGNILWVSAIALSRWIIRNHRTVVEGKSVLEIGSGLGLCGVVAGQYARSVVLTDFDPVIVRNLQYNIRCNRHLLREQGRFCSAITLDWYTLPEEEHEAEGDSSGLSNSHADPVPSSKESAVKSSATNGFGEHLGESGAQFRRNGCSRREGLGCPTGDKFDVVIGSDVVHEEGMADGVLSVLKRYLSPKGLVVVVNPHSHHRAGVERFRGLLKKEGFRHEVIGIDGNGSEQQMKIRTSTRDESFGSFQAEERQGVRCLTDGVARYNEEMNDVRLELHLISFRRT